MPQPNWKFRMMTRGEMNADPIESEFFSTEHLDSVADALVRESIQNSLDAGLPEQTVRVVFRLFTENSDINGNMVHYLEGLHSHLNAEQNGLIKAPSIQAPKTFLTIEDYGTRGLEGDPAQDDDFQSANRLDKNDFFLFLAQYRAIQKKWYGAGSLGFRENSISGHFPNQFIFWDDSQTK